LLGFPNASFVPEKELVTASDPGVGSRDFDAKMSNIKIWKDDVYKKNYFLKFLADVSFLTFWF
jgi:hypothetical protein